MVTIIMFLIFSKANFFLASLMIGGGVVADIFIYRFLVKPMLQKKGILASKEEARDTDGSEEEYIKKCPLTDVDLLLLAERYNNYTEDEFTFFFTYYVQRLPNIQAILGNGEKIDRVLPILMSTRAKVALDGVFNGRIDNPEKCLRFIDEALDITCRALFVFVGKLNHCLYGLLAEHISVALISDCVDPNEAWLYDKLLYNETPETDPNGKKMVENIRPMLEAAGYQIKDE